MDGLIHRVRHEEKSGGRYGPPFAFVDVLGPGWGVWAGEGPGRAAGIAEAAGFDLCRKGREVNRERIQELIQQAKDPVQQATLLVLSNFDSALESNTRATEVIATELQSHRNEFSEFRSNVHTHINEDRDMKVSIKTGWMAGILFFSVVNLVGGWLITRAVNSNDDQDRIIRSLEITMNQLKADIAAHRVEVK